MQVILIEDLKGVGQKGATINVKPGFARNYLLPNGLAINTGTNAAKRYQELDRQRQLQDTKLVAAATEEARKLDGFEVNIPAQANEEDHLFGSVTNSDIAEALEKAGKTVDKRKIELEDHIKTLGKYDVPVRFHGGVKATVKVWVVRP
jgi:large subunit ribosomal protein L9